MSGTKKEIDLEFNTKRYPKRVITAFNPAPKNRIEKIINEPLNGGVGMVDIYDEWANDE